MVVNESYRILAICEASGCPWRAYWRKKKSDGFTMRLSTFNNEHRCGANTDHKNRMADAVWVTTVMLEHMKAEDWDINGLVPVVVKKIEKMIGDIPNWDLEAIVILYKMRADWREYCSSYFLVSTYQMSYKGHIKPMENPRDWPKPLKCKLSANKNSTINETFVWFLVLDGFLCAYYLVGFEDFLVVVELNLAYVLGFGGKSKAKDVESSQASNGPVPSSPSQPNTRSKSKVATESPLPASPSQPSTRSKSRVASSSQPPLASPSSQPSQVPSTKSKSKVATESQPPPASPSSQPSQVSSTRSKSKVATESQPPTSPSQPSTRRKSICASSNQVPTSPSSQPSTRSKSKPASSSQVPSSPSSQPSTRDTSKEIVVSQPASSQPITRGKSKETTSSQPNTRDKTKEAASSQPSTRDKTKEAPEQRHTFANLMKRLRDTYMPPRATKKLNSSSDPPPKMAKATKQNKPPLAPPPNPASRQKFQIVRPDWKL
ncbi:hypothetical protein IFM89_031726 [Coptis chinensis]|uniref:Transposase MuDR plant domain-containing protein n=1 Tax=Coptis chinensis TaxID=261450 RepID=A0A835IGH5_9MAGN|nr:hypothetical protein IFM89_031726 [Coptis chinensis]